VLDAWGLLGSAFAPLVIIYALGHRVPQPLSIAMIIIGVATFITWQQLGYGSLIYSVAPGVVAGLLAYYIGRQFVRMDTIKEDAA
jgi:Na+/pantothenate symporter